MSAGEWIALVSAIVAAIGLILALLALAVRTGSLKRSVEINGERIGEVKDELTGLQSRLDANTNRIFEAINGHAKDCDTDRAKHTAGINELGRRIERLET